MGNMKERVAILNLNGRASIWWEHFKQVRKINERYLSTRYYDDKIKEFHELILGRQTMEE